MNLKTLALLVWVSQAVLILLTLFQFFPLRMGYMNGTFLFRVVLEVPLVLFFFYVWKKQKS